MHAGDHAVILAAAGTGRMATSRITRSAQRAPFVLALAGRQTVPLRPALLGAALLGIALVASCGSAAKPVAQPAQPGSSGAFHSADFDGEATVGQRGLPHNVAAVCEWTWDCA